MTLKYLAFLTLACTMTFSCDTTSKSSGGESRGKESGKPSGSCIPEAKLLAANIIQGTEVRPGDEDSKAVMMVFSNGELCTGSAISDYVILTAAHCVVKGNTSNTSVIFYPSLSCESGFNRATYSIPVTKIVVHPDYNAKLEADVTKGDLAVVTLASKIPDGYKVYKIANPDEVIDDPLLMYGYGKTGSNQKGAGILRRTVIQNYTNLFRESAVRRQPSPVRARPNRPDKFRGRLPARLLLLHSRYL